MHHERRNMNENNSNDLQIIITQVIEEMIFTSNLTPDKWRDFFREEDSLLCALDRTFDAATVYLMKGESYRGRNLKTYSIEISDLTE